ncbi:hypothetical protein [Kurthia sibirica]|nr:hypothetical protein [Kurthia sibirica]GEK34821.1 hypothetical protein KSI01_23540 [Kurthia sibirica]
MKSIMTIPGLKDVLVNKMEEIEGKSTLFYRNAETFTYLSGLSVHYFESA